MSDREYAARTSGCVIREISHTEFLILYRLRQENRLREIFFSGKLHLAGKRGV
jgi:hypothetical protein